MSVRLEVNCCSPSERWLGACAVRGDSAFVRRGVNGCLSGERWPGGLSGGRWLCVLLGGDVARCFFRRDVTLFYRLTVAISAYPSVSLDKVFVFQPKL